MNVDGPPVNGAILICLSRGHHLRNGVSNGTDVLWATHCATCHTVLVWTPERTPVAS